MENIELRQYRASDHDAVLQLHFKGLEQVGVRLNAELPPGFDDDLTRIEQEYLNGGDFLIATIGKEIVGMGAFRRIDDNTAEIKRMRVEPAYQGKGIGGLILDTLIEKVKAAGYQRLILDTTEKMQVARHLYRSRGFREYKRRAFGDIMIVYYTLDLIRVEEGMTTLNKETYVTDSKGRRKAVILDIKRYQQMLEDLEDLRLLAERKDEAKNSLLEVQKRLK